MRDITERIDEMCEERFGHTHWACVDTLSDQEKVGLDKVAEIITIEGQQVALYHAEGNTKCTNCGSDNAISETLSDSETGHIDECADCNYTVVYREDADTGRVIEDYQGFTHEYSGQYKAVKESH